MTRKHNVSKRGRRSMSNYHVRLEARGHSKAPKMSPLDVLRKRQQCQEHDYVSGKDYNDTRMTRVVRFGGFSEGMRRVDFRRTANRWECPGLPHRRMENQNDRDADM